MNEVMGSMLERPKHVLGGVASGLKCVAAGAVAGAVGLVAMPAMGARENGVKGFAAGMGKGLAGAVVMPVAGAVAGAVQITRGVANTPIAVAGTASGKQWDTEKRKWEFYSLPMEVAELEKEAEEIKDKEASPDRPTLASRLAGPSHPFRHRRPRPPCAPGPREPSSGCRLNLVAASTSQAEQKKKRAERRLKAGDVADMGFYDALGV